VTDRIHSLVHRRAVVGPEADNPPAEETAFEISPCKA